MVIARLRALTHFNFKFPIIPLSVEMVIARLRALTHNLTVLCVEVCKVEMVIARLRALTLFDAEYHAGLVSG